MTQVEPERGTFARRAGVVAFGTLASRLLGAARDAVIAALFPLAVTDAFFVAFTIPNALRVVLGEGAVSGAFIPVYSEVREKEGTAAGHRFLGRLAFALVVLLGLVSIAGVFSAPWLVTLYAAGYRASPEKFETTVLLTRVVFPYIFLVGLASLAAGALQAERRFALAAFAPALLNVALIAAAFGLSGPLAAHGLPRVVSLAIGALAGGVAHVALLLPALAKAGLPIRPRCPGGDPYVRKALRLLVPLLAGLGVYQLNLVLSRLFASYLPDGAQSYLYYAQRLVEIPQGMFGLAIAAVALPALSEHASRGDEGRLLDTFALGLRLLLFLAVPSAVALVVLAEPIVTMLVGRHAFDRAAVLETASSLRLQALGIVAVAAVRAVVPAFHARNDTRSPVIASAVNLAFFVVVSLALMPVIAHDAIALANTVASFAQIGMLVWLLRARGAPLPTSTVARTFARVSVASLPAALAMAGLSRAGVWERGGNDPWNAAVLVASVIAGATVYLAASAAMRSEELVEIKSGLRRRRRPKAA